MPSIPRTSSSGLRPARRCCGRHGRATEAGGSSSTWRSFCGPSCCRQRRASQRCRASRRSPQVPHCRGSPARRLAARRRSSASERVRAAAAAASASTAAATGARCFRLNLAIGAQPPRRRAARCRAHRGEDGACSPARGDLLFHRSTAIGSRARRASSVRRCVECSASREERRASAAAWGRAAARVSNTAGHGGGRLARSGAATRGGAVRSRRATPRCPSISRLHHPGMSAFFRLMMRADDEQIGPRPKFIDLPRCLRASFAPAPSRSTTCSPTCAATRRRRVGGDRLQTARRATAWRALGYDMPRQRGAACSTRPRAAASFESLAHCPAARRGPRRRRARRAVRRGRGDRGRAGPSSRWARRSRRAGRCSRPRRALGEGASARCRQGAADRRRPRRRARLHLEGAPRRASSCGAARAAKTAICSERARLHPQRAVACTGACVQAPAGSLRDGPCRARVAPPRRREAVGYQANAPPSTGVHLHASRPPRRRRAARDSARPPGRHGSRAKRDRFALRNDAHLRAAAEALRAARKKSDAESHDARAPLASPLLRLAPRVRVDSRQISVATGRQGRRAPTAPRAAARRSSATGAGHERRRVRRRRRLGTRAARPTWSDGVDAASCARRPPVLDVKTNRLPATADAAEIVSRRWSGARARPASARGLQRAGGCQRRREELVATPPCPYPEPSRAPRSRDRIERGRRPRVVALHARGAGHRSPVGRAARGRPARGARAAARGSGARRGARAASPASPRAFAGVRASASGELEVAWARAASACAAVAPTRAGCARGGAIVTSRPRCARARAARRGHGAATRGRARRARGGGRRAVTVRCGGARGDAFADGSAYAVARGRVRGFAVGDLRLPRSSPGAARARGRAARQRAQAAELRRGVRRARRERDPAGARSPTRPRRSRSTSTTRSGPIGREAACRKAPRRGRAGGLSTLVDGLAAAECLRAVDARVRDPRGRARVRVNISGTRRGEMGPGGDEAVPSDRIARGPVAPFSGTRTRRRACGSVRRLAR